MLSDNGGSVHSGSSNDPLRAGKQTTFEGGIRVPGAIHWPNGLEGGRTVSAPVAYTDIFATILRAAGVTDYSPPGDKPLDGIDMLDVIRSKAEAPDRYIPIYWGNSEDSERLAVVGNRWKLVYHDGPSVRNADLEDDELSLFDLANDPEEQHNVIGKNQQIAAKLLAQMSEFRQLQPDEGGVPHRLVGQEGFVAPKEWDMEKWAHESAGKHESG